MARRHLADDMMGQQTISGILEAQKASYVSQDRNARTNDPYTSKLAARGISGHRGTIQAAVLLAIKRIGPCIDEALESELMHSYKPATVRTRRKELAELGLIRDTGRKAKTTSGRESIVWMAVE